MIEPLCTWMQLVHRACIYTSFHHAHIKINNVTGISVVSRADVIFLRGIDIVLLAYRKYKPRIHRKLMERVTNFGHLSCTIIVNLIWLCPLHASIL